MIDKLKIKKLRIDVRVKVYPDANYLIMTIAIMCCIGIKSLD